eukprot:2183355-Rhodomonas_salina.1
MCIRDSPYQAAAPEPACTCTGVSRQRRRSHLRPTVASPANRRISAIRRIISALSLIHISEPTRPRLI